MGHFHDLEMTLNGQPRSKVIAYSESLGYVPVSVHSNHLYILHHFAAVHLTQTHALPGMSRQKPVCPAILAPLERKFSNCLILTLASNDSQITKYIHLEV